jgi:hypothetical protein
MGGAEMESLAQEVRSGDVVQIMAGAGMKSIIVVLRMDASLRGDLVGCSRVR